MAEEDGPAAALELLGLGSLLGLALVRVPAADHRSLGGACRTLRRIVLGDDFARLRETVGAAEHGLLLINPVIGSERVVSECLTHNLRQLGFEKPEKDEQELAWHYLRNKMGLCLFGSKAFSMVRTGVDKDRVKIDSVLGLPHSAGPQLTALQSRGEEALAAVSYKNCIHVFAHETDESSNQSLDGYRFGTSHSVYVFDPRTEAWSELARLPVFPSQLVACVHDGRLVVAGKPHPDSAHEGPFVYELDPSSLAWTSKCVLDGQWPEVSRLSALVSFPLRLRAAR